MSDANAHTNPLEVLLVVQEHDLACDRLRHRRATLPERADLVAVEYRLVESDQVRGEVSARRADVDAGEHRLGEEVSSVTAKATEVERTMYSGEISSPRELQALQADVEQLRRRQRLLEDQELELMESREQLDAELARVEADRAEAEQEAERLRSVISRHEVEIDAELATELEARAGVAGGVPTEVVATYEKVRSANGVGAARLVGMTCQACHLTIPSTEVDRMRRAAFAGDTSGGLSLCDNCGAILVLT